MISRWISWQATTLPNGTTVAAGMIVADAFIEEKHDDDSVITEDPVEIGSVINFNKYDLPQQLELSYVWSPSGKGNTAQSPSYLNAMYQKFLVLKSADVLLTIKTGKRLYQNMVIKNISETTDKDTENVLLLRLDCRQILMAITQSVLLPASSQAQPQVTSSTVNQGTVSPQPAPNYNGG